MFLKSLEMVGFKSFPDKTVLKFERRDSKENGGVTVIVGPNGSGKSNISDAMRWVLAENSKKTLRSSKMEDVIFGGAESRKPMGFAEVTVTFDNTDPENRLDCPYDEVTITRRYYRTGDSEFFINRRPCRMVDIYTLFLNTGIGRDGYSIIGQGMIAEIISRRSDERRTIFEDASGIAKFRKVKDDTERRLASARDNMEKVMLVFNELDAEIGPLEKEAEKAKRALELIDAKKKADVSLWLYDTDKLREDLQNAEVLKDSAMLDLQNAEDALQSTQVRQERLSERTRSRLDAGKDIQSEIQNQIETVRKLESELAVHINNISHIDVSVENENNLIRTADANAVEERKTLDALKARASVLESERDKAQADHDTVSAKAVAAMDAASALDEEIEQMLADINEMSRQSQDDKVRIQVLLNQQKNDEDSDAGILEEISGYEQKVAELKTRIESVKKRAKDYQKQLDEAKETLEQTKAALDQLNENHEELKEDYNQALFNRDSASRRLQTLIDMEKSFDGFGGAVKYIMNAYENGQITDAKGDHPGKIYGPLSSQIKVQDEYVCAIETALGASLGHVVVENEEVAKAAIYALKRSDTGRTTFLPVSSMQSQSVTHEMEEAERFAGYISIASELVQYPDEMEGVIGSLLGRTLVFDTIDHAIAMAKAQRYRVRVVTLDGQQINAGGSFTGGSSHSKNGLLSRSNEKERLAQDLKKLDALVEKKKASVEESSQKIDDLEQELLNVSDRTEALTPLCNNENRTLDRLTDECEIQINLRDKLVSDYETVKSERGMIAGEIEELKAKIAEDDRQLEHLNQLRSQKDVERHDMDDAAARLAGEQKDLFYTVKNKENELTTHREMMDQSQARIDRFLSEIEGHRQKIAQLEADKQAELHAITDVKASVERDNAALDTLKGRQEQINQDSQEDIRLQTEMTALLLEKTQIKETCALAFSKAEEKVEALSRQQNELSGVLWDNYQMTRADAYKAGYEKATDENHAELQKVQKDCTNKLRWIGNVDLGAAEKYSEKKVRYDEMKAQIEDMEHAVAELENVITGLSSDMEGTFVTAFNRINESFGQTFSELFGGGSAELSLTDPDNVLESGIEIKAAPPGKIIKNLEQLSGGEKSIVGIALFFAILKVNPTPFCFLDEIDAALDEGNVDRLANYMKRYAEGTQFIMITHRRGTMSAADRLYGVTMPTHGISKVFVLNVDDVRANRGGQWNGLLE
ncbi:MAG: chromosome segregation protein SMC [Clostridia bacterium]|nr:chromosome segregation protein SMC [Clostridia bacterium]